MREGREGRREGGEVEEGGLFTHLIGPTLWLNASQRYRVGDGTNMSARVSNVYKRFEPCKNIVVLPLLYFTL